MITREQFDYFVMHRYFVRNVKNGTQSEQESEIVPRGGTRLPINNWHEWNPESSSEDYTHIIEAIEDVSNTFGGIPTISRIIFYEKQYVNINGTVTKALRM